MFVLKSIQNTYMYFSYIGPTNAQYIGCFRRKSKYFRRW